jgi:hypothetical protein
MKTRGNVTVPISTSRADKPCVISTFLFLSGEWRGRLATANALA